MKASKTSKRIISIILTPILVMLSVPMMAFAADMTAGENHLLVSAVEENGDENHSPTLHTLSFNAEGGTAVPAVSHDAGEIVSLSQTSTRSGYEFEGWYVDRELTQKVTAVILYGDMTVYAKWSSKGVPSMFRNDHVAYVVGYKDGKIHPEANITRGETATIFFRLLNDAARSKYWVTINSFSDVSVSVWYNNAVSTISNAEFIDGYDDGTFGGDKPITRAEFAVIAARANGADGVYEGTDKFTDLSEHWANGYLNQAADMGLLEGYADGTSRPDSHITRAEAMTIVNRFLARDKVDSTSLLYGTTTWPDNNKNSWYYYAVQEATHSHDFKRKANDIEAWTKLTTAPDWVTLEHSWFVADTVD